MPENEFEQGIRAYESGSKRTARKHFIAHLKTHADDDKAWVWVSRVAASPQEHFRSLNRAAQLNPAHRQAADVAALRLRAAMVLRSWWLIALLLLGALFASLYLSYIETPMYSTRARYLITPPGSIQTSRDFTDNVASQADLMATFAELMDSEIIRNSAYARLGAERRVFRDYDTSTVVLANTSILQITTEGTEPELVALLTNTIGQETISYIKTYYPFYDVTSIDTASVPGTPISPNISRNLLVAGLLGLVTGLGLAILRSQILFMTFKRHTP